MSNIIPMKFDDRQIDIMRRTIAKDVPAEEFAFFLEVARSRGLNPFNREIIPTMRGGRLVIQTGIDGFRKLAEDSGRYRGQKGPYFCGKDGVWREEWLEDGPPASAKVGIIREGFEDIMWVTARYQSYVQTDKQGNVVETWRKMPDILLAKCAEALALRKAFPRQIGGLYTHEEMMQADSGTSRSRIKAPTTRELCTKGQNAGLWAEPAGYYAFASEIIGRDITKEPATPDERLLLDTAIEERIAAKTIVVEAAAEPAETQEEEYVSIDELSQELAQGKTA